jgi:hypothetical protein
MNDKTKIVSPQNLGAWTERTGTYSPYLSANVNGGADTVQLTMREHPTTRVSFAGGPEITTCGRTMQITMSLWDLQQFCKQVLSNLEKK